jgi:hypothetical protein
VNTSSLINSATSKVDSTVTSNVKVEVGANTTENKEVKNEDSGNNTVVAVTTELKANVSGGASGIVENKVEKNETEIGDDKEKVTDDLKVDLDKNESSEKNDTQVTDETKLSGNVDASF